MFYRLKSIPYSPIGCGSAIKRSGRKVLQALPVHLGIPACAARLKEEALQVCIFPAFHNATKVCTLFSSFTIIGNSTFDRCKFAMAFFLTLMYSVVTFLILSHVSSSIPVLQSSAAAVLSQIAYPAALASMYVYQSHSRFGESLTSPSSDVTAFTNFNTRPSNTYVFDVLVRDTWLSITKDDDARAMDSGMIAILLRGALADVQSKITDLGMHGGETPLSAKYEYAYRELVLEAWQYMSEEEYWVTYNTVLDMITGLQQNLETRLNNVECTIDLQPIIRGHLREAGAGVIRFADSLGLIRPSGTASNMTNRANETLTEYRVETQVHDTSMVIQMGGRYRQMPKSTTTRLLDDAYQDAKHQAVHFGGETPLEKPYEYTYRDLTLAAFSHGSPRQTRYKVTYNMVSDMITGLRANLQRLNGVECTVDLAKAINGRKYPAGSGSLEFSDDILTKGSNVTAMASVKRTRENELGRS